MNKAEQDFKEWYYNWWSHNAETENYPIPKYREFITLPIEFKWGVYQKFFGEHNINFIDNTKPNQIAVIRENGVEDIFESPQEAIDKAFELLNERKDG